MNRASFAEINLESLRRNTGFLRRHLSPTAFFCPMVKADAYGHGDVEVARALTERCGVTTLGVGLVEEAMRLRQAGVNCRLICFGVFGKDALEELCRLGVEAVISDWRELEIAFNHPSWWTSPGAGIHLKFNTGMNRLGLEPAQAAQVAAKVTEAGFRKHLRGVCSHFHSAEDLGESESSADRQQVIFSDICTHFGGWAVDRHIDNSSALIRRQPSQPSIGARPGLAVYGAMAGVAGLDPVMSLHSEIVQIRTVKPGEFVSYSGLFRAEKTTKIGVVPLGYADGLTRRLTGRGHVLIRGRRHRIVGAICMDYFMVDLEQGQEIEVGDRVTILGSQGEAQVTASDLATATHTIPYEVLTSISERVRRVYIE